MRALLFLTLLFVVTNCATKPLTAEEKAVRILRQSDAPATCSEIGRVKVSSLQAITDEGKEDFLKKEALKKGGNTVAIIRKGQGDFDLWSGLIYSCQ